MRRKLAALTLTVLTLAGCGEGYDDPLGQPLQREVSPGAFGVAVDPADAAPAAGPAEPTQGEAAPARREPREDVVRKEAAVGVGKKGRYEAGVITTPVSVYFSVHERLAFQRIPKLIVVYELTKGHYPKTHEEFMEGVVKGNALTLPELPAGQRYVYEPKDRKLYVEHPK